MTDDVSRSGTDPVVRIFSITKLGTKLKQDAIPLEYTPRKFVTHPHNHYFYLIESDHRVLSEEAANKQLEKLVSACSER